MDVTEFVAASTSPDPEDVLAKETLCAVRMNRDEVNVKTSYIRTAQEFLVRTFLTFSLILLVTVLWKPAVWALDVSTALGVRVLEIIGLK